MWAISVQSMSLLYLSKHILLLSLLILHCDYCCLVVIWLHVRRLPQHCPCSPGDSGLGSLGTPDHQSAASRCRRHAPALIGIRHDESVQKVCPRPRTQRRLDEFLSSCRRGWHALRSRRGCPFPEVQVQAHSSSHRIALHLQQNSQSVKFVGMECIVLPCQQDRLGFNRPPTQAAIHKPCTSSHVFGATHGTVADGSGYKRLLLKSLRTQSQAILAMLAHHLEEAI